MPCIKLSVKYKDEREDICNKLLEITGNEFLLYELDNNQDKKQAIMALKDEVAKYFAVGTVASFKPNLKDTIKREYLNILKYVAKQQGYNIEHKEHVIKYNTGHYQKTSKYKIFRESYEN
jgi:hypothetical protein